MIDFEQFAHDVHANAARHGWWDEPATFNERKALIHDELSEALEEYRNGHSWLYYTETLIDGHYVKHPEGIATELIDAIIRMLDIIGKHLDDHPATIAFQDEVGIRIEAQADEIPQSVPALINLLHDKISAWYQYQPLGWNDNFPDATIVGDIIAIVFAVCKDHHIDPEALLKEKHDYNTKRPYRHGNKLC